MSVRVVERGIVPCQTCKKPHDRRRRTGRTDTWADPVDGHAYYPMTAEQVIESLMATFGVQVPAA